MPFIIALFCLGFVSGAAAADAPPAQLQARAAAAVAVIQGEVKAAGLRAPVRVQRDR